MTSETALRRRAKKLRERLAAQFPMPESVAEASPPAAIALPPILDAQAAGRLAEDLLARRGVATAVDASGVRRLSAQCFQVLVAAFQTWRADGASLSILNSSPEAREQLEMLGARSLGLICGDSDT